MPPSVWNEVCSKHRNMANVHAYVCACTLAHACSLTCLNVAGWSFTAVKDMMGCFRAFVYDWPDIISDSNKTEAGWRKETERQNEIRKVQQKERIRVTWSRIRQWQWTALTSRSCSMDLSERRTLSGEMNMYFHLQLTGSFQKSVQHFLASWSTVATAMFCFCFAEHLLTSERCHSDNDHPTILGLIVSSNVKFILNSSEWLFCAGGSWHLSNTPFLFDLAHLSSSVPGSLLELPPRWFCPLDGEGGGKAMGEVAEMEGVLGGLGGGRW